MRSEVLLTCRTFRGACRQADHANAWLDECVRGLPRPPKPITTRNGIDVDTALSLLPDWARQVKVYGIGFFRWQIIALDRRMSDRDYASFVADVRALEARRNGQNITPGVNLPLGPIPRRQWDEATPAERKAWGDLIVCPFCHTALTQAMGCGCTKARPRLLVELRPERCEMHRRSLDSEGRCGDCIVHGGKYTASKYALIDELGLSRP